LARMTPTVLLPEPGIPIKTILDSPSFIGDRYIIINVYARLCTSFLRKQESRIKGRTDLQ
jgi:hypothetical protein